MVNAGVGTVTGMKPHRGGHHVVKAVRPSATSAQFNVEGHHGQFALQVVTDASFACERVSAVQVNPSGLAGFGQGFVSTTVPWPMPCEFQGELVLPVLFGPRA